MGTSVSVKFVRMKFMQENLPHFSDEAFKGFLRDAYAYLSD